MYISVPFDKDKIKSKGLHILSYLLRFFSRKDVSVICFILAIVIKLLFTYYYLQIDYDKLTQAMAGKNLVEGHGIAIKQVHTSNLSKESYEPLAGWPPGYSLLISLIYLIVKDLDFTCFILDVILVVLYFIVLRKICKQLAFPVYLINLVLLFSGAAITPYVLFPMTTDFLTLVVSMYNCSLSIEVFNNKNARFERIQLAIFNALPVWFKYVYIPVTFVIPAFILWNGVLKKDRSLLKYGLFIMLLAFLSTMALFIYQIPYADLPAYTRVPEKGIFLSNLLRLHPILFSAFINVNFYCTQLSLLSGFSYAIWAKTMQWISVGILSLFLYRFLQFSFNKKWQANTGLQAFLMIGGLTSISILLVLAFMSLTHNAHFPPPEKRSWTYVSEGRYYAFLEFLIFIVIGKYLFNRSFAFKLKTPFKWFFLFLCIVEITHGIYFLKKNFTYDRRNFRQVVNKNRVIDFIHNIIIENKKKNVDVVVFGPAFSKRAVLLGGKGLFNRSELNSIEMHAEKPTLLIAVLDSSEYSYYKPFLNKKGVTLEKKIEKVNCFSYYIEAGQ